jgi:P27 family predicted phage terminase small subunit
VLRLYCDAVVRYNEAAALLEKSGPLVRGVRAGELVKNPLHQVVRDNATLVRTLAGDLGLSPSSRVGLKDRSGNAEGTSVLEDLFARRA